MTQINQKFQAAAVGAKFKNTCVKFDKLLTEGNSEELTALRKKLREELKAHRENGILTVAFVGQYNAGKSTTISALTGRRDIRIDSDIATDKTANYDWNGIKLIDTPGLFTDRKDHDDITYEAIAKADLLVFCLTYMLFDSVTAENFKKLAYEKGYRWKMMLVVNKMSDEAGEEEQKIANYRKSLAAAIEPYRLDEFPICFIDAKDYCEGVDEGEDFLIEVSRFQTFIDALNNFVERRASLARFDTPVRIALGCVDEAQLSSTRNSNEDSAFFEVLARLARTMHKERERLRTKVQSIALRLSSAVVNEGTPIAAALGGEENIEALSKQAEINVRKHYEKAGNEMEEAVNQAVESLQEEVQGVLQSDLVQTFVARLGVTQTVSAKDVGSAENAERLKDQVNQIKIIGEQAGVNLANLASRGFLNTAGQGFLRSRDVVGSTLHQGVLTTGKMLGFKFRPWQAVNTAKNIGNIGRALGPILGVAMVAVDIYAVKQEHDRDKKLADARREITSQFLAMAKDLKHQIELQLWEAEAHYREIEKKISEARQQQESMIASSNTWVKQLVEIRKDFELILRDITKATENPTA